MTEVDFYNPVKVEKFFMKMVKDKMNKALKLYASAIADYILQEAKKEISEGDFVTMGGTKVTGALNSGELMRSGSRKTKPKHIMVGFGAAHSADVEYGLSPQEAKGRVKYPEILQWVKEKKIATGSKAPRVARLILKSIHKFGIAPRPYFRRALARANANKGAILKAIEPDMRKILGGDEEDGVPEPEASDG